MEDGPTCTFNGKNVPCFVCSSPKASISSQFLSDMLEFMDELKIFSQTTNLKQFLLLDGHHS
jgi:hypothetical protein